MNYIKMFFKVQSIIDGICLKRVSNVILNPIEVIRFSLIDIGYGFRKMIKILPIIAELRRPEGPPSGAPYSTCMGKKRKPMS